MPRHPERWGAFRALGVALLLITPFDWIVLGRFLPATLAVRAVWASLFFAATLPRLPLRLRQWGITLGSCVLHVVMIQLTGGLDSRHVAMWPLLPMLAALLMNDDLEFTVVAGVLSIGLGAWLIAGAGQPAERILVHAMVMVTSTALAFVAGRHLARVRRTEREIHVERARREHLERVAIAERRQRQSERLAVMGQIAANIAHELRNPLASIRGNLELAQEAHHGHSSLTHADVADAFADARKGIERIHQISDDLRRFAREDSGAVGACDVASAIDTAVRLARHKVKRIASVHVQVDPALPPAIANEHRLSQVILNLLVNAGDALEETLEVGMGTIRVRASQDGPSVTVAVEDDGPGVPPEVLPRLFEPFFTTKDAERGTGLGLALSKEIVHAFGGDIVYQDVEGGGARFVVTLRRAAEAPVSQRSA